MAFHALFLIHSLPQFLLRNIGVSTVSIAAIGVLGAEGYGEFGARHGSTDLITRTR